MPSIQFAFDRQTARSMDADGRMRVRNCVLSVAEVNPYYGKEIPGSDALGLKPETVYEMYRDPEELRRGADSFDGLPLMIKHIAQTADEPRKEYIGGAVHDVRFEGKTLRGDLLVWDGEAIDLIESGTLSDLSCSYRYKPVMRSGEANGKRYDGVMTDIQGNHVALVDDGRATGAHVADAALQRRAAAHSDSQPTGAQTMPLENQPGAAAPAPGSNAGEQNEQANMAMIGQALKQIGVVLQDIHAKISGGVNAPAPAAAPEGGEEGEDGAYDKDEMAGKTDGEEPDEKADDMELEPGAQMAGEKRAEDGDMNEGMMTGEKDDAPPARVDGTGTRGGQSIEPVIGAMDAKTVKAVNTAVDRAIRAERARVEALSVAKEEVRYVLGADLAYDSAADVYRAALVQSGVRDADIPKGSEKTAWQGFRIANAAGRGAVGREAVELANDSALKNQAQDRLLQYTSKIRVQG